ncbi:vanomycin resistance protein VanB, partial [Mycobacterium sp. ITM-2017-0098]
HGHTTGQPAGKAHPELIPGTSHAQPPRFRRLWFLLAAPFALLATLYLADLILAKDRVPRGVTAAGVPIGGLTLSDAEERLRASISPRTSQPVPVTFGGERGEIDPTSAGL